MPQTQVYVVSEDLHLLLDRWSSGQFGKVFDLPYAEIRTELAEILAFGDHRVVQVSAGQMEEGIVRLLDGERRPVISVDPVYYPTDFMLQITRCVHPATLDGIDGFHSRFGFPHPDEQLSSLVERLRESFNGASAEVVIVDDVVFSGKVVAEVIRRLGTYGIRVARVVCGIAVVEQGGSDPFAMCAELGATLDAAYAFGTPGNPNALDEICERDFFVFCPMSGRSAASDEANIGFPYIEPFGLGKWASFGPHAVPVSARLAELNVRVIEAIERQLGRDLVFADLERYPARVRHHAVDGDSVRLHLLAHLR